MAGRRIAITLSMMGEVRRRWLKRLPLLLILVVECAAGGLVEAQGLPGICKDPPFEEGEMARFVIKIGPLKVGEGTGILLKEKAPIFEMNLAEDVRGQEMWHVKGRGIATKPLSFFFKVDDTLEVWTRQGSFLPYLQELRIDHTNERSHRRIFFDHAGRMTDFWQNRSRYHKKSRIGESTEKPPLEPDAFDIISLFLHLRCAEASVGDTLVRSVHEGGKNYIAKIHVERIETIKTPLGKKEALRADIKVFFDGNPASRIPYTAWVSNDERRIPLRFVADLPFANLKGVVAGYRRSLDSPIEGKLDPDFVEGTDTEQTIAEENGGGKS